MKTYRKPITKAINLEGEQILAGSIPVNPDGLVENQRSKRQGFIYDDDEEGL